MVEQPALPAFDRAPLDTLHLQTTVRDCLVSTVKLACPHPFGDEADADFETMVFVDDAPTPGLSDTPSPRVAMDMQWRYHTIQQARAGHDAAVYHLTNHLPLGETMDFWRQSEQVPTHLRHQRCWPEEQA